MARTEATIEFENSHGERLRIERGDDAFVLVTHADLNKSIEIDFDDIDELVSFLLAMKG